MSIENKARRLRKKGRNLQKKANEKYGKGNNERGERLAMRGVEKIVKAHDIDPEMRYMEIGGSVMKSKMLRNAKGSRRSL